MGANVRNTNQLEECANCGRTIGKLETANVFKDSVVCSECYARLAPTIEYATPVVRRPAPPPPAIYSGHDVKETTDAVVGRVIVIVLLIVFILACLSVILAKMSTWS